MGAPVTRDDLGLSKRSPRGFFVAAAAIAGLGAVAYLAWQPVAANYDSAYGLVWGRSVLAGHSPDYEAAGSPTPHPLLLAFGVVAGLAGDHAHAIVIAVGCGSLGWLIFGIYRLGSELGSRTAGTVATLIFASSGLVGVLGVSGAKDIPYLALIVAAIREEVQRPASGARVLLLLGLAGLIRPEAWLLAMIYAGYVVAVTASGFKAAVRLVALAAVAPVLWVVNDLVVTGNPLFSFTYTRHAGESLGRPTGASGAANALRHGLPDVVSWPVVIGGVASIVWAWRRQDPGLRIPVAAAAAAAAALLAEAAVGLPVTNRVVLALALMLTILFATAVGQGLASVARGDRRLGLAAPVALLAFAVSVPGRVGDLRDLRTQSRATGRAYADLRSLLRSERSRAVFQSCRATAITAFEPDGALQIPLVAYGAYPGEPRRVHISQLGASRTGALILPLRGSVLFHGAVAAGLPRSLLRPPRGFRQVAKRGGWSVYASGCAPRSSG